jgi:hypothetical protein
MLTLSKVVRAAFSSASKLLELQLREDGAEGDDEGARAEDQATFLSQLGVAVRPVVAATLRALTFEDGDDTLVVKLVDKARSPTDLDEGETRVYSAGTIANVVRLLAARIVVEAPEIRLGAAATKKVNREGDAIRPGTLSFTATTSTLTIVYTPPDGGAAQTVSIGVGGAPAVFTPLTTTTFTLGGKTGAGSNKVRAED